MNDFMSRIYFTKIKFLLQKIVLKLLLKKHTLKSDTISGNWKPFQNNEKCLLFHLKSFFSCKNI